jgi:hypothetical protein
VLFFITFVVLALSKLLLGRLKKAEEGGHDDGPQAAQARQARCAARQRVNRWRWRCRWPPWPSACSGWSGSCGRRCAWAGRLSLALFTEMTPPPNEAGGLANAIFGSLMMVAWPPSSARRSA